MQIEQKSPTQETIKTQPYLIKNIKINISSTNYQINIYGCLIFDQDGYSINLLSSDLKNNIPIKILIYYSQTTSIGKDKYNIMAFLGDQQEQNQQQIINNQMDEENYQENQEDNLLKSIQQSIKNNQQQFNEKVYNLSGNYTITFYLEQYGQKATKQIYQYLTNYLGEDNQQQSDSGSIGEMISANNIGDNGQIIFQGKKQQKLNQENQ